MNSDNEKSSPSETSRTFRSGMTEKEWKKDWEKRQKEKYRKNYDGDLYLDYEPGRKLLSVSLTPTSRGKNRIQKRS